MSRATTDDQPTADTHALAAAQHMAAATLRPRADADDANATYPATQIKALAGAGLMGMAITREYGGLELSYLAQARIFAALTEGDLTTAFVVSQHQACTTLVTATPQAHLRDRWLRGLADGTVHGANGFNFLNFPPDRAPMKAIAVPGGYHLNGSLPWVTAANHSALLVGGAVLPDGLQILAAIPLREALAAGDGHISVDAPMLLAALSGSDTTEVHCHDYFVAAHDILLGPGENVLKATVRGAAVYVPTSMTLGHARASLAIVEAAAARKGGTAGAMADWMKPEIAQLDDAITAALTANDFAQSPVLRGRGNALAVRAALYALIAGGGTGYRQEHTPQRLYREAGFFSVWSVSGAIIPETLSHLITTEMASQ